MGLNKGLGCLRRAPPGSLTWGHMGVAHHLCCLAWKMLDDGVHYSEQVLSPEEFERLQATKKEAAPGRIFCRSYTCAIFLSREAEIGGDMEL
jgi:hypothetical protein